MIKNCCVWILTLLLALRVGAAEEADVSRRFPVDQWIVSYGREHPTAPNRSLLEKFTVDLFRAADGALVATGTEKVTLQLGDSLPAGSTISAEGLRKVFAAIVAQMNQQGYFGILTLVNREQIDLQTNEDFRPASDRSIKIAVWFSEVATVRSVAKGSRILAENSVSNPKHAKIVGSSPIKAAGVSGGAGSLFDKRRLDDYLRRLNRHPGRSVEAALSSTEEPGRVVLDYLVTEQKTWLTYAQVSNTGTAATDILRERVGFVQNQLFGRDDIASVDYITSNIAKANAVFGSYNYPLWYPDRLRLRAFGSWGDFNATTPEAALPAGATGAPPSERFSGNSWSGGGELVASPFSFWKFAIDFSAGATVEHVAVNNKTLQLTGQADLLTPYASVRVERTNEVWSFSGSLGYETSFKTLDPQQMVRLGRLDTQDTYDLVRGEFNGSTYVEPILFGISSRNDWRRSTLAHEVTLHGRFQYVLGKDRLIPQKEQSIGGFFSARGYPESAVAGDNVYSMNAEYRFHIPRALRPAAEREKATIANEKIAQEPAPTLFGRSFNLRPSRVYSRPDWDLVARAFFDAGYTEVNYGSAGVRRAGENNYTLMSTGLGFELQMLQNINLRADWGYVLQGIKTGIQSTPASPYLPGPNDTKAGSSRLHCLLTLVW
jgi:hypothetical protein